MLQLTADGSMGTVTAIRAILLSTALSEAGSVAVLVLEAK